MSEKLPTVIATQGGSVVGGNVITHGGDFVGRDKNVYISAETAYDVAGLPNPYLGLRSFTYRDRRFYTGRDREIEDAVKQVTTPAQSTSLLFITGASGSGKSSFAQAGLVPALEEHYQQRHFTVKFAVFRPAAHPVAMLKDALLQLGIPEHASLLQAPPTQVNLLVIDQFEELFTQSDRAEKDALCEWLVQLPSFAQARTLVLITVRSDYLSELAEIPELWPRAKEAVVLRAMSVQALSSVMQRPLQLLYPQGEKRLEPALVDKLASDAASDPTFLPLLQVTLEELWRKGKLTLAHYHNLTDALKQRADQILDFEDYNEATPIQCRSPERQATMLAIFLDLVKVSVDTTFQRDVRVSRAVAALVDGAGSSLPERKGLLDDLVNARLLSITSEAEVEIANIIHESLIRNWERLQKAIVEKRQSLLQRTRFEQALQDWLANQRSPDYLLHGVYLAEARQLAAVGDIVLRNSAAANAFLQDSIAVIEAEQQMQLAEAEALLHAEQRAVARTRLLLLVAVVFSAVLCVPVAYRLFLRWDASRLGPLVPIAGASVLLGYTPATSMTADNYLPLRTYDVAAFQIEKYEVTNQRYVLCIKASACSPPNAPRAAYETVERARFPVVNITALQAEQFCAWLGRRLPTDLQWERAARYTDQRLWPWGNALTSTGDLQQFANFQSGAAYGPLQAVGSLPQGASVEGVADLAGNAWEWTQSPFALASAAPITTSRQDISLETVAEGVSVRGGGADVPADLVENLMAYRLSAAVSHPDGYTGFRCITD